jgi:hypothetical protein
MKLKVKNFKDSQEQKVAKRWQPKFAPRPKNELTAAAYVLK